jgi:hypothetical protein
MRVTNRGTAAIDARKSTEQNVSEDAGLVTRQIEHDRAHQSPVVGGSPWASDGVHAELARPPAGREWGPVMNKWRTKKAPLKAMAQAGRARRVASHAEERPAVAREVRKRSPGVMLNPCVDRRAPREAPLLYESVALPLSYPGGSTLTVGKRRW